ncbi:3-dehydroquinate synthase [Caloramator fervidus]|uniref:3-dehydroquinate synthase n=1 Tax=Caloramator fervidus TaxID=29344 RepID=A0A1H5U2Q5_9CLOT|nr:3-dehydroquinate synthase [Caloramator fervidus]SEF68531.1 3-dehydroquinate synthase [Caloramator fervidus]
MKEIKVNSKKSYSVFITNDVNLLRGLIDTYKLHSLFILTDENVYNLYGKFLDKLFPNILGLKVIKPGEKNKNINTIMDIYDSLIEKNADKKTTLVAFGGGVVGDIAGFIASTYMRGIKLIHVPTTLMAQCDSSIGGKNGFDYKGYKNIIGSFYQPEFVFSNINFLKTLDDRQYLNGLAEIIKYAIVCDINLLNYINQNKKALSERESDKLFHIVYQCSKIKAKIIEEDEFDLNKRQILNFGHTVGHAIESYFNFEILHGEAVAIGMITEAYMAMKLKYIDEKHFNKIVELISYFNLPTKIKVDDIELLFSIMHKDKKKTGEKLKFVLPYDLGHAIITTDLKENFIFDALKYCLGG